VLSPITQMTAYFPAGRSSMGQAVSPEVITPQV
jgi:hypothetical protein